MYNITKPFSKTGSHEDLAPRPPQTTLQPFVQLQCIGGTCHKLGGARTTGGGGVWKTEVDLRAEPWKYLRIRCKLVSFKAM